MLLDIAEFDRTEAWRGDGSLSMRDWLVAHCHVSRARARTLVEAAAKANELPALSGALSEGRLTLDVFAPLASVATPETDADLARASEHWTPKQARELVSEVKGATDADAAAQFQRRFVRFDDERCLIWAQLTGDSFALVKSAILGRARRHDHPSANDPDYVRFESRCADALLQICVEQGRKQPRPHRPATDPADPQPDARQDTTYQPAPVHGGARTTMIVHTDLDRLLYGDGYGHASIEGVGPISAEVARRLACNAHITLSFDAPDGTSLDQKQLERDPTEAQRIEIRRRDKGCRFPGCGCKNVTDVHHIVWASKQGPTVMSNLLTLCVGHHSRVHELGWKMDGDAKAKSASSARREGCSCRRPRRPGAGRGNERLRSPRALPLDRPHDLVGDRVGVLERKHVPPVLQGDESRPGNGRHDLIRLLGQRQCVARAHHDGRRHLHRGHTLEEVHRRHREQEVAPHGCRGSLRRGPGSDPCASGPGSRRRPRARRRARSSTASPG